MPKSVSVRLDGERHLRFDINALADAEEALGVGLGQALQSRAGIRELRALLWAGLRWEDKKLTLERTGEILQEYVESGGDLTAVAEALTKALAASGLIHEGNPPRPEAASL